MLQWVESEEIEPHIPVFDKFQRTDGTFSREDFSYDRKTDSYTCPTGKELLRAAAHSRPSGRSRTRRLDPLPASKADCEACALKQQCCPNASARKVTQNLRKMAMLIPAPT